MRRLSRITSFLLASFVCLGITGLLIVEAKSLKESEAFYNKAPEGFSVFRRGRFSKKTGKKGHYIVMSNAKTKTMALIAETRPRDTGRKSPLDTDDLSELTRYLLEQYVGLRDFKINVEKDRWLRMQGKFHHTQWLRIKFKDVFEEADTIIRFNYPRGRQVIVLMGRPATGGYEDCPVFRSDYFTLEKQAVAIAQDYNFIEEAEGDPHFDWLGHYLKNIFKSHHRKNCF